MSSNIQSPQIPLCIPSIKGREWPYIKECLDTNWVSSAGPFVERFEHEFKDYLGINHSIAVSSGTSALHLALIAAGVEPNDEVIVSDLTFIAPVNAIRYVGAWPILVDACNESWGMNPSVVKTFINGSCETLNGYLHNKKSGRRIGAIIPVHILGHPVDLNPIVEIALDHGLPIIEDATESLGATYKGNKVGTIGQIGCFSFNGNKLLTTGGGGMAVCHDSVLASRIRHLSKQAKKDPVESIHDEIGFNYRLTNIQAAMGCAQLERINELLASKKRIAQHYDLSFKPIPGITPMPRTDWSQSACWMYTVLIDSSVFGMDRHKVMQKLASAGIQTRPLWQPIQFSPAHDRAQFIGGTVSQRLHNNALSLPCSPDISKIEQDRVIEMIKNCTLSS